MNISIPLAIVAPATLLLTMQVAFLPEGPRRAFGALLSLGGAVLFFASALALVRCSAEMGARARGGESEMAAFLPLVSNPWVGLVALIVGGAALFGPSVLFPAIDRWFFGGKSN